MGTGWIHDRTSCHLRFENSWEEFPFDSVRFQPETEYNWKFLLNEIGVRSAVVSNFPFLPPTTIVIGVENCSHVSCTSKSTDFGLISYRETNQTIHESVNGQKRGRQAYGHVTDETSGDCARTCFETAGCSSFYVDHTCNMIIGLSLAKECEDGDTCPDATSVTESGAFHGACENGVFTNRIVKKSRFFCKFLTQTQEDNIVQQLINENELGTTPLEEWIFETSNTDPLTKTSQYVSLIVRNFFGENTATEGAETWIAFELETHFKTASQSSSDRSFGGLPVSMVRMTIYMS